MDHKGYYAIIPANVRYDQRLPANAKLLYGEITALSNEKGYCWAGNDYFSVLYGVSKTSVSKWVSALRDSGYINVQVQYKEGTKQILHRYITLVKDPIEEKLIDNNTSNNTNNNTMNIGVVTPEKKVKKVFVKPTLTEVIDFCNETQANIDPQDFMDFYESKGWMVGRNKMKCWKSCVRRWKRQEVEQNREKHEKNMAKQAKQNEQLRNRTIEHQLTDTSWAD